MRRSSLLAFFATVTLSACQGSCGQRTVDPLRFVSRDAEAVLEVRDFGVLAKNRAAIGRNLGELVTVEQLTQVEKELELSLGFSPLSEKGLEEAGLPKEGKIAVEISPGATGALWVLPVKDAAAFEKAVDRIARTRANVDATEKVQVAGRDATALLTSFGTEKVPVATYAFSHGLALIGAGADGRVLLERALTKKVEDPCIIDDPEYAALVSALGERYEARLIAPKATQSMDSATRALSRIGGNRVSGALSTVPKIEGMKSIGWALGFEGRDVRVRARARLAPEAMKSMAAVFGEPKTSPAGVNALAFEDAVLFAHFSGDPKGAIATLAPAGSEARADLDAAFQRVKTDLEVDLERDVIPTLSGHAALAMGVSNLAGKDLRAIAENPAAVLWTSIALGAQEPKAILEVEKKMDAGLGARGLTVGTRVIEGQEARTLSKLDATGTQVLVLESVARGGARIFSNEGKMTELAVKRAGESIPDPHAGKAGVVIELRLAQLAKALRTFELNSLPLMYRAVASKALQLLDLLHEVEVHVAPASDGVAGELRLSLSPDAAKAGT